MLIGMRLPRRKSKAIFALSIALALVVAVCLPARALWGSSKTAPADRPIVEPAGAILNLIEALPSYGHFSLTGITFYKGQVFVGSNIGLIEVKDSVPLAVYRWDTDDAVVEGPWADKANDSLWIQRDHDGVLLRMDQAGWHLVSLPASPNGYYTRGDVLAGFQGVSDPSGFRLVGGGFVWSWGTAGGWTLEPSPPVPKYSAVEGVAISGSDQIFVAQLDTCVLPPCRYAAYWREANGWGPAITVPMSRVEASGWRNQRSDRPG